MTTTDDIARRVDTITADRGSPVVRPRPFESARLTDSIMSPAGGSHDQAHGHVGVSVVVPLCNEAGLAERCYTELSAVLRSLGRSYEIVFADDGSTDGTAEILRGAVENDPCIDIIRLPHNVGQHQATLVGMRAARGEIVITMDADLHVDPAQIARLLQVLHDDPDCDVASGARTTRASGILRRTASRVVAMLSNRVCGTHLQDPGSTFKAMRRCVVRRALENEILAQNLPLFVAYAGFRIREVPVSCARDVERRSTYRLTGLAMILALAMLNYSSGARTLLVLLMLGWGIVLAGVGLCTGSIVKGMVYQTPLVSGLLLAGLVALVFGGQFVALSFLGYKLEFVIRNLGLRGTPASFHQDHLGTDLSTTRVRSGA